ncbi:hypothetical protein [Bacteroides fragilis]|uniref:hypothetical protein n=1 Tax=Bacteroides fragilis TaxID=817 RepID=UPI001C70307E|nr:hypothetical protein [Bacteroides fragilis]MBW9280190.1 hypothetical protein [Bacteroides fragilis]
MDKNVEYTKTTFDIAVTTRAKLLTFIGAAKGKGEKINQRKFVSEALEEHLKKESERLGIKIDL